MSPGGYNLTYGGEGTKPGEETREKLRKAFLGRKISEEHRQKISSALKGRKMPEEKLQKMLGKGLTEQHRRKISKGLLNHEVSEKTRMRIRKSKQGKPRRPHSEESKQRIREGVLRYWRNKNEKTESVTRTS